MTNYILFPTTRAFIRGMKAAEAASIPHRVLAVPTHITHECGMCLQIENDPLAMETLAKQLLCQQIEYQIISEE